MAAISIWELRFCGIADYEIREQDGSLVTWGPTRAEAVLRAFRLARARNIAVRISEAVSVSCPESETVTA